MAIQLPMIIKKVTDLAYATLMIIIISVVVGVLMYFPVMWLWNFIFGEILKINVFQAWALIVLCGILFSRNSGSQNK